MLELVWRTQNTCNKTQMKYTLSKFDHLVEWENLKKQSMELWSYSATNGELSHNSLFRFWCMFVSFLRCRISNHRWRRHIYFHTMQKSNTITATTTAAAGISALSHRKILYKRTSLTHSHTNGMYFSIIWFYTSSKRFISLYELPSSQLVQLNKSVRHAL